MPSGNKPSFAHEIKLDVKDHETLDVFATGRHLAVSLNSKAGMTVVVSFSELASQR